MIKNNLYTVQCVFISQTKGSCLGVFYLRISFVGKAPCRKFKFELEFIKSV